MTKFEYTYKAKSKELFGFYVYSTHEKAADRIFKVCEKAIKKIGLQLKKIPSNILSYESQLKFITNSLTECAFAIVLLDGLRPNIVFEFGILVGLNKPCIVIKSKNAKIDFTSLSIHKKMHKRENPIIDIDKHFSDIKDKFYHTFEIDNLRKLEKYILDEIKKQNLQISDEIRKRHLPRKELYERKLSQLYMKVSKLIKQEKGDLTEISVLLNKINIIEAKFQLNPNWRIIYNKALAYMKIRKFDDALALIKKTKRGNVQLDFILAQIYRLKGMLLTSYKLIKQLVSKSKYDKKVWILKAQLEIEMKQIDTAYATIKRILSHNPDESIGNYLLAFVMLKKAKYNSALEAIDKALRTNQNLTEYIKLKKQIITYISRN